MRGAFSVVPFGASIIRLITNRECRSSPIGRSISAIAGSQLRSSYEFGLRSRPTLQWCTTKSAAGPERRIQRPAEVADRAAPGHWEGDLIIGRANRSVIGTLVEHTTRYVLLAHLPDRNDAETVRDGPIETIGTLPAHLRQSLTWDQGSEMTRHKEFFVRDRDSSLLLQSWDAWQRGSNENTNGLLRQYFPKGTDLSIHSAAHLWPVAWELNTRPRKTLDWTTPATAPSKSYY